jgi:hypothetical protein
MHKARSISKKNFPSMQRHDSQERMGAGSPRAASLSASLDSSPSGSLSRSAKRQRVSHSGSRSTRQASVVTEISGTPESFNGRTTAAYKTWLQDIQPAHATHQYTSCLTKDVAECFAGVWYVGKVQCIHQGIKQSMTRNVSSDSILPNKSQPFSIVWEDDTDTICDLSC